MGDLAEDDTVRFLEMGDEFALQTLPERGAMRPVIGYVTARGDVRVDFMDGTNMETTNPPSPHDCRLVLHTKNQYGSSKALRKAIATAGSTDDEKAEAAAAADLEGEHNDQEQKIRIGTPTVFGSAIQLYASGSDSYIQCEKRRARDDSFAQLASLVPKGAKDQRSKMPWFRLMPGFATRAEGERVRFGDIIYLESIKSPRSYLHYTLGDDIAPGDSREINVASFLCRFQVVPVAKREDVLADCIRGGDFLQLYQRESRSYLHRDHDGSCTQHVPDHGLSEEDANTIKHVDVKTEAADMTWQIELPMMKWSGANVKRNQGDHQPFFSLKDAMSGLFLQEQSDGTLQFSEEDDDASAHWELAVIDEDTILFEYESTSFWLKNVGSGRILHRSDKTKAVEEEEAPEDEGKSAKKARKRAAKAAASGTWSVITLEASHVHADDLFICRRLPDDLLLSFQETHESVTQVKRFHKDLRQFIDAKAERRTQGLPVEDAKGWDAADLETIHLQHIQMGTKYDAAAPTIARLDRILLDISLSDDPNPLTRDGVIQRKVQDMLHEFRMIPLLLDVLDAVMELVPVEDIVNTRLFGFDLLNIVQTCYRVLRQLCHNNDPVSRVLCDNLPRLESKFGYKFNVVTVVTEVFNGTPDLIRTVKPSLIEEVWSLALSQRHESFLKFLCVVLESEDGTPIKFNQDKVTSVLLTKNFPEKSAVDTSCPFFERDWHIKLEGADRHDDRPEHAEFFFHAEFVKLASLMCAGRHRASIDFFLRNKQFGFSYLEVMNRLKKGNPCPSCSAYLRLMRSLYVDREPYEPYVPVQKARILPTIDINSLHLPLQKRVDPYKDLPGVDPPTENFTDLKLVMLDVLRTYHPDAAHTDSIDLMIWCLELTKLMLLSGLFDSSFKMRQQNDGVLRLGKEAKDLGEAIIPLVDGRKDRTLNVDLTTAVALTTMKRKILEVMNILFSIRASTRIDVLLQHWYGADDMLLSLDVRMKGGKKDSNAAAMFDSEFEPETQLGSTTNMLFDEEEGGGGMGGSIDFGNDAAGAFEDEETGAGSGRKSKSKSKTNPKPAKVSRAKSKDKDAGKSGSRESTRDGSTSPRSGNGGNRSPVKQNKTLKKTMSKDSRVAADLISAIRVFPPEMDDVLADILTDILRCEVELRFLGFETLITLLSQGFAFSRTIRGIVQVCNREQAKTFMLARDQMSEYRRLRKWLHQDEQCAECIQVVIGKPQGLMEICKTFDGQNLIRCLNIEEHGTRMLRMRLESKVFDNLIRATLDLLGRFCKDNPENQALMIKHLDEIFVPLMWIEKYMDAAAGCVMNIIGNNRELSLTNAPHLVSLVSSLTREHGTHLSLLMLLKSMVLCDGLVINDNQTLVCKGVLIGDVLNLSGELDENEWAEGPGAGHVEMLKTILEYDQRKAKSAEKQLYKRCCLEAEYYTESLKLLALCTTGTGNPATGIICSSVISFHACVVRLHEIYDHPELQKTEEDLTGAKYCTVCYFREVFVETTAAPLMKSLSRERNGLWSLDRYDHAKYATPIGLSILNDMKELADCFTNDGRCTLSERNRAYLFDQAVPMMIDFVFTMSAIAIIHDDDLSIKLDTFKQIGELMVAALRHTNWTNREKGLLQTMKERSEQFATNKPVPEVSFHVNTKVERVISEEEQKLTGMVNSVVAAMDVRTIEGTTRTVGVGIMKVAEALWQMVPGEDNLSGEHTVYASLLVEPLRLDIAQMLKSGIMDSIPSLLTMLDTVRAIMYVVNYEGHDEMHTFEEFVQVGKLDGTLNPELVRTQTQLAQQGWALLCFEILAEIKLAALHLCALRLLITITSAGKVGNPDCQRIILEQLRTSVPEVGAKSLRYLLRSSATDLKLEQRHQQVLAEGQIPERPLEPAGFAVETLTLMMNLCEGNHKGLQDYLMSQPGQRGMLNLVVDVVAYLNDVERYLILEVDKWVEDPGNYPTKTHPLMERAFSCFRVLITMCTGPNQDSQLATVQTDIISMLSRIIEYCPFTKVDVIDGYHHSPKRKLNSQITRLVVSLLEGEPPKEVLRIIHRGLSWPAWERQLVALRKLMQEGTIANPRREQNKSEDGKEVLEGKHWVTHDEKTNKTLVCSVTKAEREALWIAHDAFKFMSVYDKIMYYVHETNQSTLLFEDAATVEYFQKQIGQVQIVRHGNLERMFFWMPAVYFKKDQRKEIQKKVIRVMDASPRLEPKRKLDAYVSGCLDVIEEITQKERTNDQLLIRIYPNNDLVLFLSFCSGMILLMSWDPQGSVRDSYDNIQEALQDNTTDILSQETLDILYNQTFNQAFSDSATAIGTEVLTKDSASFTRWQNLYLNEKVPEMWLLHTIISSAHLIICLLGFNHFTTVAVPIMLKRRIRDRRRAHKQATMFEIDGRDDFLRSTLHVYGLHDAVANHKALKEVFSRYGAVTGIKLTYLKGHSKSWAIITFSNEKAVDRVKDVWVARKSKTDEFYVITKIGVQSPEGKQVKEDIRIMVSTLSEGYVASFGGQLSKHVDELEYELSSSIDDSIGFQAATEIQDIVNFAFGRFGSKIPVQSMFILRWNPELWEAILDILMSIFGFFSSPLYLSYHLTKVRRWPIATIVLGSVKSNWVRISTTILLGLLVMYYFAITGVLLFQADHTAKSTSVANSLEYNMCMSGGAAGGGGNKKKKTGGASLYGDCTDEQVLGFREEGPCGNLLSCFISYTMAGLMQQGLEDWLIPLYLPLDMYEFFTMTTLRIFWEISFMLVTSCIVISIITGIICDTFGELRIEQDEARRYRDTTCFITDIPYATLPPETSTGHMQYVFLLLYLDNKEESQMSPLETYVSQCVAHGEIDWIPHGRSFGLRDLVKSDDVLDDTVKYITEDIERISDRMVDLYTEQSATRGLVENLQVQMKLLMDFVSEKGAVKAMQTSKELKQALKTIEQQDQELARLRKKLEKAEKSSKKKKKGDATLGEGLK